MIEHQKKKNAQKAIMKFMTAQIAKLYIVNNVINTMENLVINAIMILRENLPNANAELDTYK